MSARFMLFFGLLLINLAARESVASVTAGSGVFRSIIRLRWRRREDLHWEALAHLLAEGLDELRVFGAAGDVDVVLRVIDHVVEFVHRFMAGLGPFHKAPAVHAHSDAKPAFLGIPAKGG